MLQKKGNCDKSPGIRVTCRTNMPWNSAKKRWMRPLFCRTGDTLKSAASPFCRLQSAIAPLPPRSWNRNPAPVKQDCGPLLNRFFFGVNLHPLMSSNPLGQNAQRQDKRYAPERLFPNYRLPGVHLLSLLNRVPLLNVPRRVPDTDSRHSGVR